jgi:hypothetical protein
VLRSHSLNSDAVKGVFDKLSRMGDDLSKAFGLTIAFLLPGLVGLYALSFFEPRILDWFGLAAQQEASVGGFLFVVVSSIGTGVFVSGLRWLSIDWIFGAPPAVESKQRTKDQQTEQIYQDIRIQHYQFYQFYANMLCALVLTYIAWFVTVRPVWADALIRLSVLVVAGIVLLLSARNAVHNYDRKVLNLLSQEPRLHP